MKELLAVFTEKLKQLETEAAVIVLTLLSVFTVGMSTIVAVNLIKGIVKIVELIATGGHESVKGAF